MNTKLLYLILTISFSSLYTLQDTFFVFVIASYNNKSIVRKNLESIFLQNYDNYHILYCDDASTDGTDQEVIQCCSEHNKLHKLTYLKNATNSKALYSIYNAIHNHCKDTDVILLLDGDDWLINDPDILHYLNNVYQNPTVWATYGEFFSLHSADGSHGMSPYSQEDIEEGKCRYQPFYFTHMRTFYAGLFKKIKLTDFIHAGEFFHCAWDLPIAFPLLEMAQNHIYYNQKQLYVYNNILTTNDHTLYQRKQAYFDFIARNKKRYKPIENITANPTPKITHLTFINKHIDEESAGHQIAVITQHVPISSTIACLPNRNHHLCNASFFKENTQIIPNCSYHSWISDIIAHNLKNTIAEAIFSTDCDYFFITETGDKLISLSFYNPELLKLADIIIIGTPAISLPPKILTLQHPHVRFLQLNTLGTYLNFKEPSAIIISKDKLVSSLEKGSWLNGSYLSYLALISNTHASEYTAFIPS